MNFELRPFRPEDADSLALHLNNRRMWDNLRDMIPQPYSAQDAEWFIDFQRHDPSLTCYAIAVEGYAVGNVGFVRGTDVERFGAEVGYYLGEEFWGRGIMTQAVLRATDDYFATTDVVRLFATPFAHNAASAKVLERTGFQRKCTLNKAAYKNGHFVDMIYYEKLK